MTLDPILDFAKKTVIGALLPGATVIDATVGNGHDTLFLARHVGKSGHVYGFDMQAQAIAQTRSRLDTADVLGRVTLFQAGHEMMDVHLPAGSEGRIAAIMFNLGYLPGSDKTCITRPETTVEALKLGIDYLMPGGVITVVLYTGHAGGEVEANAVEAWVRSVDPARFQVLRYQFINQRNDPPWLLAIERKTGKE